MATYLYPTMPLEDTESDQTITLTLADYNKLISAYYKAVFACNQNNDEISALKAELQQYKQKEAENETK